MRSSIRLIAKVPKRCSTERVPLGERMKGYETSVGSGTLDPNLPFIVRADGTRFSKLTKSFEKPFDDRIHLAMLYTTRDLVTEFNASTGFTASDEISLVFPQVNPELKQNHLFNGRIQKIVSLVAGYTSARFNYYLHRQCTPETNKETSLKMQSGKAFFDARAFNIPPDEALNNISWRMSDCKRNSISIMAQTHFTSKELHKVSGLEMIEKLKHIGVDWHASPEWYRLGLIVKKVLQLKEATLPSGEKIMVHRNIPCWAPASLLSPFSLDKVDLLLCKSVDSEAFPSAFDSFQNFETFEENEEGSS